MTHRRVASMRGKRGISPVIATVILVAVAITVAVSVAFWMGGISGQYTRFEKLQVQDPVITTKNNCWNLTFPIKNTGTTDATIDNVFINGISILNAGNKWRAGYNETSTSNTSVFIVSGNTTYISVYIPKDDQQQLTSGTTIEVKFRTASGYEYPKMVTLP